MKLKIITCTAMVFGLLTLASYLMEDHVLGLPFWFYKDACSISVNMNTGETFGETTETNWLNLGLNVFISLIITYLAFWLLKRGKNTVYD